MQGGRADAQRGVKAGVATHGGKLLHTEQRFKVTLPSPSARPLALPTYLAQALALTLARILRNPM